MGHIEVVRQVLVLKVLNCLLQGDNVPLFLRNVFLDSSCFSTSRSRVPIVDTEPSLLGPAIGHVGVKAVFLRRRFMSSGGCVAEGRIETFRIDDMMLENGLMVRLRQGRKTISYGRDIFLSQIESHQRGYGRANLLGIVPICLGWTIWLARTLEGG